jgi:hypothetical protein
VTGTASSSAPAACGIEQRQHRGARDRHPRARRRALERTRRGVEAGEDSVELVVLEIAPLGVRHGQPGDGEGMTRGATQRVLVVGEGGLLIAGVERQIAESDLGAQEPRLARLVQRLGRAGAIARQQAELSVERQQARIATRDDQRAVERRARHPEGGGVGTRAELHQRQRRARHREGRTLGVTGVGALGGDERRAGRRQIAEAIVQESQRLLLGEDGQRGLGARGARGRRRARDLGIRPAVVRRASEGQATGHLIGDLPDVRGRRLAIAFSGPPRRSRPAPPAPASPSPPRARKTAFRRSAPGGSSVSAWVVVVPGPARLPSASAPSAG